jgi:hypothetical protein
MPAADIFAALADDVTPPLAAPLSFFAIFSPYCRFSRHFAISRHATPLRRWLIFFAAASTLPPTPAPPLMLPLVFIRFSLSYCFVIFRCPFRYFRVVELSAAV